MRHRAIKARVCGLLSLALMLGAALPTIPHSVAQDQNKLLVIVAASLGITNFEIGTLRRLYQGYPVENAGTRLIPFNHVPRTPIREMFDKALLGLTADQVGRYWIDQRVRQGTQPPRTIPSPDLMIRVVASYPGAVGYVSMSSTPISSIVRVVAVDGKQPGDAGYPLSAR